MKKIGFTCGSFDVLHPGHVQMFEDCKEVCDYLIVGLQQDPTIDRPYKNKPVQDLYEREIMLEGVKYIDEIMIYTTEKDLYHILEKLKFDVRIIGSDWKDKPFTGHDIPGMMDKIYWHEREHGWSSSELRNRIYKIEKSRREKND